MRLPSQPVLNDELTAALGKSVIKLEVIPVREGETLRVTFQSTASTWRQGLWLGVNGDLEIDGVRGDQFEVWTDNAPPSFEAKVVRTEDGLLRLYNIWDSGRGRRRESQSATSGMLKEVRNDGAILYRSSDIGVQPRFDKLVFRVESVGQPAGSAGGPSH